MKVNHLQFGSNDKEDQVIHLAGLEVLVSQLLKQLPRSTSPSIIQIYHTSKQKPQKQLYFSLSGRREICSCITIILNMHPVHHKYKFHIH